VKIIFTIVAVSTLAIATPFANTSPAYGQDANWTSDRVDILRLLSDGYCSQAWDALWPHLKIGNKKALLFAAQAIPPQISLRFPGAPKDLL
jgi:hypothetical protein